MAPGPCRAAAAGCLAAPAWGDGLLLLRAVAEEAGEGESVRREDWEHRREGRAGQEERGARD